MAKKYGIRGTGARALAVIEDGRVRGWNNEQGTLFATPQAAVTAVARFGHMGGLELVAVEETEGTPERVVFRSNASYVNVDNLNASPWKPHYVNTLAEAKTYPNARSAFEDLTGAAAQHDRSFSFITGLETIPAVPGSRTITALQ